MQEIRHTHISCGTGFWVIDTQEIAWITWQPEDDTFMCEGVRRSRAEMVAFLESPEVRVRLEAEEEACDYWP